MAYIEQLDELHGKLEPEDAEFLQGLNESYAGYAQAIESMERIMQLNRFKDMDVKEYQESVKSLDNSRKVKHDACMSSLSITNRIALANGMAEIFPGLEGMDRTRIADAYILPVAKEYETRAQAQIKPEKSKPAKQRTPVNAPKGERQSQHEQQYE